MRKLHLLRIVKKERVGVFAYFPLLKFARWMSDTYHTQTPQELLPKCAIPDPFQAGPNYPSDHTGCSFMIVYFEQKARSVSFRPKSLKYGSFEN